MTSKSGTKTSRTPGRTSWTWPVLQEGRGSGSGGHLHGGGLRWAGPSQALQQTAAVMLVARGFKMLGVAAAAELGRSDRRTSEGPSRLGALLYANHPRIVNRYRESSTPGPVHVVEIVDHPSLLRRRHPSRCCVSALDAGMSIPAKNPSQPK